MIITDLDKVFISSDARPKQHHVEEARRIVRQNSKYRNDPGYRYFLGEVVTGLCKGCSNEEIFRLIRSLQKMIKPRVRELGEDLHFEK
ncbi:ECU05_1075 [Encephalitozoon cuniculi GB-M1]|uniref:ECU05_1075 protein n=1 Tax=Encephalitozoon cuniculi (strain GB-M1) TaxID=284813 RepID=I7L4M2_ENCCU|nr:uncharacterized protein ECU05_1075 [Encephalitozoon cuniculi GB-M1]UYI27902.1 hypothetical protein J0A71_08g17910 [Encephalitozoon cuniculi]CCI74105.1 ECU05_1075 [Encephalitozoon cuniculi GB-M1]